ncbi:MAG: MarR family transcriptional regulator [Gammaproteobacteria bacterium]|nr:MarR family transcriptional regulator [Gammaproteobacteria bacterium]
MSATPIYVLFERLANLLRAEERQLGADNDLQPVHLYSLYYLSRCNRFSDNPAALTEYLGMTKGTVSQSLQLLVTKGLISKQGDKEDRRLVHLCLTDKGKKLVKKLLPPPIFGSALEKLQKKEAELIEQAFNTLLRAIQTRSGSLSFGECKTCEHCLPQGKNYLCGLTQEELKPSETLMICREHHRTD